MKMLFAPVEFFRTAEPNYVQAVVPVVLVYVLGAAAGGVTMWRVTCDVPLPVLLGIAFADVLFGMLFTAVLLVPFVLVASVAGRPDYSRSRLVKCLGLTYWFLCPIGATVLVALVLHDGANAVSGICAAYDGGVGWVMDAIEATGEPDLYPSYWSTMEVLSMYFWLLMIGWQSCALYVVSRCGMRAAVGLGFVVGLLSMVWVTIT